MALGLEAAVALGVLYLLTSREEKAAPPPVTEITLAPVVETPKPATPVPPTPTPVSKPVTAPVPREAAHAVRQPTPSVSHDPAPEVASPQPAPQEAQPPPAQAAPQAAPQPPLRPVASSVFPAGFGDKVRAAVQSAVVFPMAARASHLSGRTQVAFYYQDGTITGVKITTSSGNALLDKAALAAVNAAQYPPPPQDLQGNLLSFEIWVRFLRLEEQAE